MVRARRAALAAFVLAWSVATLALTVAPASGSPPAGGHDTPAVAWPASPGLLIAEVVTGGMSASDEYVEITNASSAPIDLNGLELAYASAAGTSAIRRAGWAAETLLAPGRHLLIANAGGTYAPGADATYTAGMAATGGALVLRPSGGTPIDALGWGTATNAFVETAPAPAPPAGSSIERGPGGSRGNVRDTNSNATDWAINPAPRPENLGAPARPAPGSSPSPSARPSPSPSARPSPSPSARPSPSPSPSPRPSASASPQPTPSPTPRPSAPPSPSPSPKPSSTPTPSASSKSSPTPSPPPSPSPRQTPTPTPTPSPSPSPSPTLSPVPTPSATLSPGPTPSSVSIADAIRTGGSVTVDAVVTTNPTLIDPGGRLLVIQDSTGAIEVRLPVGGAASVADLAGQALAPGAHLRVSGEVGRSYGAPRISASAVAWLGWVAQPRPLRIAAAPGPGLEWRLVVVTGRLDAVHRLGLRWRADLIVGAARIPVVGLTGARIPVGRLLAGRGVTVIGIVRRAYPSAIDQRFAIDLRSVFDITFESAGPVRPRPGGQQAGSGDGLAGTGAAGGGPVVSVQPIVDLGDLAARRGQLVRVGGLVTRIDGAIVSLDDGTATGRLMLSGAAAAYLDLVQVGDPLEATGVVESDATGPYLLVTEPDGVARAGDPGSEASAAAGATNPGNPGTGQASPANGPADARLAAGGATGTASIDLLEALALALLGALVALLITLVIARLLTRRRVPTAGPAGSEDGPRARPTLGPS